jgi:hypothetical protein
LVFFAISLYSVALDWRLKLRNRFPHLVQHPQLDIGPSQCSRDSENKMKCRHTSAMPVIKSLTVIKRIDDGKF